MSRSGGGGVSLALTPPRLSRTAVELLALAVVAPDLVDLVTAGEGQTDPLRAVGQDVALDPVHVGLGGDAPQRPAPPPVVDLLTEALVDRLGRRLASGRVGVRLDHLQRLVDDVVL